MNSDALDALAVDFLAARALSQASEGPIELLQEAAASARWLQSSIPALEVVERPTAEYEAVS